MLPHHLVFRFELIYILPPPPRTLGYSSSSGGEIFKYKLYFLIKDMFVAAKFPLLPEARRIGGVAEFH